MPMSLGRNRPPDAQNVAVILRAAELGITLWDTADAYCIDHVDTGHNERLFAEARRQLSAADRERVIIATKGGHVRPEGRWEIDGRPEHLREALDASLKALGVERIDLYQFHRPDPNVPFLDSVGVLAEALQAGKVRYVGLSNVSPDQIDAAIKIVPVVSVQNQFSVKHRNPETDGVLAKCRQLGLAFLAYSPLGGAWGGAKQIGETGAIGAVAADLGISPQRLALEWLLSKYDRLIPIPGATRVESVQDSAQSAEVTLSPEQVARLDASFA
jgi:aryl-alcohol dehydrogenase-like predicted oxidoreductase